MLFDYFLCTVNSYWISRSFAISKVKDLPYLPRAVSVGFNPHPIPLLHILLHSDLANQSTIFRHILKGLFVFKFLLSCLVYLCFVSTCLHSLLHRVASGQFSEKLALYPYGIHSLTLHTFLVFSLHSPYGLPRRHPICHHFVFARPFEFSIDTLWPSYHTDHRTATPFGIILPHHTQV